ncbi:CIC11C00000002080 [Sungouiella intermedia]|uniref:Mediator of RNA polymerase II transcription subunit 16 n=1 Tax=Sungouiella intermedia TaxID=45354 RepID=A0A1L0DP36_9ASCO|nr:CIC11C00000002080 [[Candida] intermedia]
MPAANEYPQDSVLPQSHYSWGMQNAISWSKHGFVTYAMPPATSGFNLYMTYLENVDGKDWQLARPQGLTIKPLEDSGVPELSMVQWSNLLTDLAVFDEQGNFYILLAGVGLLSSKGKGNGSLNGNGASIGTSNGHNNGSSNGNGHISGNSNGTAVNGSQNGASKPNPDDLEGPSYELTSYNHTEMIFRDISPTNGPPHSRCVAFKWLGIEKPQIINKAAELALDGRNYSYGVHQHQIPKLAHPIATKQACVALRQNGIFNLYYQGEHKVEYHKLSVNLAADGSEGYIYFSHASIGFSADRKIIVVAYEAGSKMVYTYSISVDWGFLVDSAVKQKTDPHYHTPKEGQKLPRMTAQLLHQMAPVPNATGEVSAQLMKPSIEVTRLKLIDVVSPYYNVGSDLEILLSYDVITGNAYSSTIFRYHLKDCADSMEDVFANMAGDDPVEKGKDYSLVIQDKMTVGKRLQQINTFVADSLILIIYEDGTIDAVDRSTWAVMGATETPVKDEDMDIKGLSYPQQLKTILDCGFRFPRFREDSAVSGPLMVSISPNMTCMAVQRFGGDTSLELKVMNHPHEAHDTHLTAIGVAYSHAHACYANTSSDDIIVLIREELERLSDPTLSNKLVEQLIIESHRAINFQLNSFSKESVDKLLSNPPMQKLLSLQLAVSEHHTLNRAIRDLAWVVLNLRSTSFGIMFSLSSIYRQISKKKPVEDSLEDSISRAECIILLVGNVKWLIDLIVYLNQELLQLALTRSRPEGSLINIHNSVALPIIMSKVPRLFLMYALSSIGKTHEILKKLQKDLSESNKLFTPMKEALNRFFGACNSLPLNLSIFESFLREVEILVSKEVATRAQLDSSIPLKLEQHLFCLGVIPDGIRNIANMTIERHAASINRDMKLSELYFYDSSWIDVGIASREFPKDERGKEVFKPTQIRLQYSPHESVDALRKVIISASSPITSGGVSVMGRGYDSSNKVRKCTRCRSVSLVADPLVFDAPSTIGLWTMVFQRTCICGSTWVNCS